MGTLAFLSFFSSLSFSFFILHFIGMVGKCAYRILRARLRTFLRLSRALRLFLLLKRAGAVDARRASQPTSSHFPAAAPFLTILPTC